MTKITGWQCLDGRAREPYTARDAGNDGFAIPPPIDLAVARASRALRDAPAIAEVAIVDAGIMLDADVVLLDAAGAREVAALLIDCAEDLEARS